LCSSPHPSLHACLALSKETTETTQNKKKKREEEKIFRKAKCRSAGRGEECLAVSNFVYSVLMLWFS